MHCSQESNPRSRTFHSNQNEQSFGNIKSGGQGLSSSMEEVYGDSNSY